MTVFRLLSRSLMLVLASLSFAQTRTAIFLSDTHFGVGKVKGKWHPYEDARWADEFGKFLEFANRDGHESTDLIFNGDTFELWQSLTNDCVYQSRDQGCSKAEALSRMRIVLDAHKQELKAIHDFAVSGHNAVYIVPGNHDAALLFPDVAAEVLKFIGSPTDRVRIVNEGYWLSQDRLIYSEHGHQIGADVNFFRKWPEPFITVGGRRYLSRPWGEEFVQGYYNQFEYKYPIIDNISPETEGLRYGFAAEGAPNTLRDFGLFVRFYLTQQSAAQLSQVLGDANGGGWDVDRIRAEGNTFFYESIPEDDPLRAATKKAIDERTFGISVATLSADEINGICETRRAQFETHKPGITLCPRKNLGAVKQALVRSRESIFMAQLNARANELHKAGLGNGEFQLFVYSHTHVAEREYSPFQHSASRWMPIVMNTGAWQRTVNKDQLDALVGKRGLKPNEVLKLQPEDLPACYPFIVVPPYNGKPVGKLQYWAQSGNSWTAQDSCDHLP
jgi:hypothetical protein